MTVQPSWFGWFALVLLAAPGLANADSPPLRVLPKDIALKGNFAQAQLLVTSQADASPDRATDLTPRGMFQSSDETVVQVTAAGRLIPRGNGTATILVANNSEIGTATVTVTDVVAEPVVNFRDHLRPVINKNGCVMGGCHSAQYGQGGFKLTVFGFDSAADREAMVRDAQGRRVNFLDPTDSLLLKKPTMTVPHGGGRRLEVGSRDYELIAAWIRCGAPAPAPEDREITKLVVTPSQRLCEPQQQQQLRVEAHYADGEVRDVTAWAKFDSVDESVVNVTRDGLCTVQGRGQTPVMVRFEGQAGICTFVVPYGAPATLAGWTNNNFVDELAATKFQELGIEPSGLCDDATFLRRIFLDATGTLPSVEEIQEFTASTDSTKRQQWIDRLLGVIDHPQKSNYNDRYAAYWTLKWSDLVRNNSRDLQDQGMWSLHNWIKEQFRANVPFHKFVGELVQGKGSVYSNGPANYFLVNNNPNEAAESTAQLFLGVRLQCAQCHHHPFEKYGQDDYYSFAAFFARVGIKTSQEFGLFGGERVIMAKTSGEVRQPRSGKTMPPKPLDAAPVDHPLDRRIALAEWMTSQQNTAFARATVNRYLNWLMGRGLVDPVDDLRATNPPTNVALMDALTDDLMQHQYNIKHLIRTVMSSRLYQLDAQPTSQNVADERFYSHFHVKRLTAEPLLDAIDSACGTRTKFKDLPLGTRAIEIPDAEYPDFFLNTFAKPRRTSVCECERPADPNLAQALHTLNGDILSGKIADKNGRVAKLIAEKKPHAEVMTDLYLATLCRPPTNDEIAASERLAEESPSPQEGYEDLLWALINSKAFLFVR
jgi:hypothetical protein